MSLTPASLCLSIAIGNAILLLLRWQRRVNDLPPGPMKLPMIGNLLNMPTKLDGKVFAEMGKRFASDIIHFEAFGTSIVVINSRQIAEDLLEKRSGIYSSRPRLTMFNLCGWGFEWIVWPYGERWRNARKLFTQGFSSPKIHRPREVTYINVFLRKLLDDPAGYYSHIRHLPGAIALDMTYGMKVEGKNDPFIKLAEASATDSADVIGETYLVELLPILKHIPEWFPGAAFQRKAAQSRAMAAEVLEKPFRFSEDLVSSGDFQPSFVTNAVEDMHKHGGDREFLKEVAATVYLAGSDTTTAALSFFFLAMVLHQDVQKKIQEELDQVLQGALPRHEDLDSLPYLEAVIKEVIRWRPITPLGVPHTIESEDIYGEHRIPAGSLIIGNEWAMLHDGRDYPNPEKFDPNRFFKAENRKVQRNPFEIAFGFGRRTCPGRHIALSILMLTGASVLSVFDVKKTKDNNGVPITPSGECHGAALVLPNEFPCRIVPRSEQTAELVRSLSDA